MDLIHVYGQTSGGMGLDVAVLTPKISRPLVLNQLVQGVEREIVVVIEVPGPGCVKS